MGTIVSYMLRVDTKKYRLRRNLNRNCPELTFLRNNKPAAIQSPRSCGHE